MPGARGKYSCPLCFRSVDSIVDLIRHSLNEIRLNVVYRCLECKRFRDRAHWSWFDGPAHSCFREKRSFTVNSEHHSLDDLKTALSLSHKIRAQEVDNIVKDMNWAPPRNPWLMKRKHHSVYQSHGKAYVLKHRDDHRDSASRKQIRSVVVRAGDDAQVKKTSVDPVPASREQPSGAQVGAASPLTDSNVSSARLNLDDELGTPPTAEVLEPPSFDTSLLFPDTLESATLGDLDLLNYEYHPTPLNELPPISSFLTPVTSTLTSIPASVGKSCSSEGAASVSGYDPERPEVSNPRVSRTPGGGNAITVTTATATTTVPSLADRPITHPTRTVNQGPPDNPCSTWIPPVPITLGIRDPRTVQSRYPTEWTGSLPSCRGKCGMVCLSGDTTYFRTNSGEKYMQFLCVHRKTGSIVVMTAPAVNCTEDVVLRDHPELIPYAPGHPTDMEWVTTYRRDVAVRTRGILMIGNNDELESTLDPH